MQSTSKHMHKSTQADVLMLGYLKQGEIDSVSLSWCVPKQQGYFWKTFSFLHHLYLPATYRRSGNFRLKIIRRLNFRVKNISSLDNSAM